MTVSSARVQTENAASYMRKLGQHWSHRFPVAFEGDSECRIEMPNAICSLRAHPDALEVELQVRDEAEHVRLEQPRLENVVEEHIKRFAFREPLEFMWSRSVPAST